MTFYNWSDAQNWSNCCTCLWEKPPSLIMGLNVCRADNTKQTLLDFSFSLLKNQKTVTSRRVGEWEGGGVSEGWRSGGQGCCVGCFSVSSARLKKFQTLCWAKQNFVTLNAASFFIYYRGTVYVHINAASVSFRNAPNGDTDYRIFANMIF